VNALVIAVTLDPAPALMTARHHLLDLGQMCALALASAAGARIAHGWSVRRRLVALFLVALALDALFLREDLFPRATKLGGSTYVWLAAMIAVAAASAPITMGLGALARRRAPLRVVAVLAGLQLGAFNHLALERNYPGVHLHALWLASLLIASALADVRTRAVTRRWLLAPLVGLALGALVVRPPSSVLVRALASSGSALVPFVARAHAWLETRTLERRSAEPRAAAPPTEPPVTRRDLVMVMVTIDSLRADVLGNDENLDGMPTLRALRDEGVWFTRARSAAPATIVSLTTVFSGRYFSQLYWSEERSGGELFAHQDPTPRVPELLSAQGVHTVVVHGLEWLRQDAGVAGRFDDNVRFPVNHPTRVYALSDVLVDGAIERLAAHGDGPLFLYMHWLEAHSPYDRGDGVGTEYQRYLGEVRLLDRQLGRLVTALRERFPDRAAVVVTADHGEGFGEHHVRGHALTVFEEVVRVPIVVALPGVAPRRVEQPVSLIDLGPTLLDLFGATTPASFEGTSLVPLIAGETAPERLIVIDSGRGMRAIVFGNDQKLIDDRFRGTVELFDLKTDPGELKNVEDVLATDARARLEVLRSFFGARELVRDGYSSPFRPP
jgi:hypothetical protein